MGPDNSESTPIGISAVDSSPDESELSLLYWLVPCVLVSITALIVIIACIVHRHIKHRSRNQQVDCNISLPYTDKFVVHYSKESLDESYQEEASRLPERKWFGTVNEPDRTGDTRNLAAVFTKLQVVQCSQEQCKKRGDDAPVNIFDNTSCDGDSVFSSIPSLSCEHERRTFKMRSFKPSFRDDRSRSLSDGDGIIALYADIPELLQQGRVANPHESVYENVRGRAWTSRGKRLRESKGTHPQEHAKVFRCSSTPLCLDAELSEIGSGGYRLHQGLAAMPMAGRYRKRKSRIYENFNPKDWQKNETIEQPFDPLQSVLPLGDSVQKQGGVTDQRGGKLNVKGDFNYTQIHKQPRTFGYVNALSSKSVDRDDNVNDDDDDDDDEYQYQEVSDLLDILRTTGPSNLSKSCETISYVPMFSRENKAIEFDENNYVLPFKPEDTNSI